MNWFFQFKLEILEVAGGFLPRLEKAGGQFRPLLEWVQAPPIPVAPSARLAKVASILALIRGINSAVSPSAWGSKEPLTPEEREYLRRILDLYRVADAHKELTDLVEVRRGEI